jgi:ABC-type uncharacterized transport system substrate-binding protein
MAEDSPLLKLMLGRRAFVAAVVAIMLTDAAGGHAQPGGRTYRIGYLGTGAQDVNVDLEDGLRDLGYLKGQNLLVEYRFAQGDHAKLPGLARELVALKCELIVANSSTSAIALRQATTSIPIVFLVSADPVGAGLVQSLSRPGSNVTGPSAMSPDFVVKRLELLREILPRLRRLAVLFNPAQVLSAPSWKLIAGAAPSLAVSAKPYEARNPAEVEEVFKAMARDRSEGVLVINDPMLVALRTRLAELTLNHRLPAVFEEARFAEAGGLIAYGPHYPAIFRRAASYVDRILRGASPADLPVEQPTEFRLIINVKTARAMGLALPPALLARADRIIE